MTPHPKHGSVAGKQAAVPVPELPSLQRRIRVALGQESGDLLLTGGQVVNVFTQRIEPANIVTADGWIAGVGPYDWPARQTIALSGRIVLPGLIDAHMHLESTLLTPAELARLIVPHGTTAIISDSHEIGNVLGIPGMDMLLSASVGLPLDLFFMASSCVPATKNERAGAVLGPADVRRLLDRPRILGLAEVMDTSAVLAGADEILQKIHTALERGLALDGHAPGLTGRDLQAYVAAGIRSDHESSAMEEARAKAALGMLVQVREGSSARNLDALLPLLAAGGLGDFWCLVTDDIFPDDLRRHGHLDGLLRRVVAGGVPAASAVRHATLIPARHYGLSDRGAVAPGYRADLLVVDDVRDFHPHLVLKDGQTVARGEKLAMALDPPRLAHENTIHCAPLEASAFQLRLTGDLCPVIRIVPGQIVTRHETQPLHRQGGCWVFDPESDVVLIASIERHRAIGEIGLGLVSGFGLRRPGALGSSVAHDSHNLIIAGTNGEDMLACVRALEKSGGGFVVSAEGTVRSHLPLPIAGLLSEASADTVCQQLQQVQDAARSLGCELTAPFGTLSFLALPVIPELRITTQGLFDVKKHELIRP
jgi:adenine deaminase